MTLFVPAFMPITCMRIYFRFRAATGQLILALQCRIFPWRMGKRRNGRACSILTARGGGLAVRVKEIFPLSPMQQGTLFHYLYSRGLDVDIEQIVGRLREQLDIDALRRVWQQIVGRLQCLEAASGGRDWSNHGRKFIPKSKYLLGYKIGVT